MGAASVQTRTLPFGAEMDLVFKHSEGTRDTAITQLYLAPISIALGLVTGLVRVLHTCYAHVMHTCYAHMLHGQRAVWGTCIVPQVGVCSTCTVLHYRDHYSSRHT